MANIVKKNGTNKSRVITGSTTFLSTAGSDRVRRQSEPMCSHPPAPPSPALSHLTQEEIQILQGVIQKQEDFEKSHESRARNLESEIKELEDRVRRETTLLRGKSTQGDLRLCRLCFKNKFSDCIGRICCDCHRRVCNRCGSFILARNKQSNKGRWRCNLCQKRREYACLTGVWFHGSEGKPSLNSTIFHRKLSRSDSLAWVDSDWSGESLSGSELGELHPSARGAKTDSELSVIGERTMAVAESERERTHRRSFRRRGSAASDGKSREEEEDSLDADQFMLERRKCRRERLEQQRRANRRRSSRRGSFIDPDAMDSGSNMDLSPDGRSQNSSMSEKSLVQSQTKSRESVVSALQKRPMSVMDRTGPGATPDYSVGGAPQKTQGSPHRKHSSHRRDSVKTHDSWPSGPSAGYHQQFSPQSDRPSREHTSRERRPSRTSRSCESGDNRWSGDRRRHRAQSSPRLNGGQAMANSPGKTSEEYYNKDRKQYNGDKKMSSGHERHKQDSKERRSSTAGATASNRPKGAEARRQRRPSVDASCQISEGDAPLAVLQRAAFKAAAVTLFDPRISAAAEKRLPKTEPSRPGSAAALWHPSPSSSPQAEEVKGGCHNNHQTSRDASLSRASPSQWTRKVIMHSAPASPHRRHSETPRRMLQRQESLPKYSSNGQIVEELKSYSTSRNSSRPRLSRGNSLNLPSVPTSPPAGSGSLTAVNFDTRAKSLARSGEGNWPPGMEHEKPRTEERRGSDNSIERLMSEQQGRFSSESLVDSEGMNEGLSRKRSTGRRHSAEALWPSVEIKSGTVKSSFSRQTPWRPFRTMLHRDPTDTSCRTTGFGMRIMGGKVTADGTLGAFVTSVVSRGPADQSGIRVGDQILEWNGQNLEDTTFEEVRQIIDRPADAAQLVVVHTAMEFNTDHSDSSNDAKNIPQWHPKSETRKNVRAVPGRNQRRMLPKTPVEVKKGTRRIYGQLNMALTYESLESKLTVRIIQCTGLPPRDSAKDPEPPHPFAIVFILPNRSRFPALHTTPKPSTKDPYWETKLVFAGVAKEEGEMMPFGIMAELPGNALSHHVTFPWECLKLAVLAVEVTIWDYYGQSMPPFFLGELLLDLANATLDGSEMWFPLEDHDENNSSLPILTRDEWCFAEANQYEDTHSQNPSLLPATPAHDKAKKLLDKKPLQMLRSPDGRMVNLTLPSGMCESSPQLYKRRISPVNLIHPCDQGNKELNSIPSSTSNPENLIHSENVDQPYHSSSPSNRTPLKTRMMRQVSEVVTKVSARLADKRSHSLDSSSGSERKYSTLQVAESERERRHSHSGITSQNRKRSQKHYSSPNVLNPELLTPPIAVCSRSSSQSSSSCIPSATESDFDDSIYSASPVFWPPKQEPIVEGTLGPGQLGPKANFDNDSRGAIQLGLFISKGQMELDIVRARGLSFLASQPDTYVKTCLVEGSKRFQQKKTKTTKESSNPTYRQQLKYDACNIHGRHLKVQVKLKTGAFERGLCLGEVYIRLDSIDLSKKTTGWYRLFRKGDVEIGSTESLHLYSP